MEKVNLSEIAHCFGNTFETIRDKYDRVDESGINHGRSIYYDRQENMYYKLFHIDYVRRSNFEMAINENFFDGMVPGLKALIIDDELPWETVVGYITKGGKVLSDNEFDTHLIPNDFKRECKYKHCCKYFSITFGSFDIKFTNF